MLLAMSWVRMMPSSTSTGHGMVGRPATAAGTSMRLAGALFPTQAACQVEGKDRMQAAQPLHEDRNRESQARTPRRSFRHETTCTCLQDDGW